MKRFYKQVSVAQLDGGWQVRLDGRGIKTARGAPQIVAGRKLAELLAAEWEAQGEELDPKTFVYRDLADYAIDVAAAQRETTIEELLRYAETDTLCYRADPEEALFRRQQDVWEPLVAAFETREGVRLERVSGVIHRKQPEPTLAALRQKLAALDPFTLAGLQMMTSLAASLCVGLSALEDRADATALWDAASLEEDWQAELWGHDREAEERREIRRTAFMAAFDFVSAARSDR